MPADISALCDLPRYTAIDRDLPRTDPEFVIERLEKKCFQCFLGQIVDRNTAQAAKHVKRLVSSNDEIPKCGGGGIGRVHASANGPCRRNFRPEFTIFFD